MKKLLALSVLTLFLVGCSDAPNQSNVDTSSDGTSSTDNTAKPVTITSINMDTVLTLNSSSFDLNNYNYHFQATDGTSGSTNQLFAEYTALEHHAPTVQEFLLGYRIGTLPIQEVHIPSSGQLLVLGVDEREYHIIKNARITSFPYSFDLANGFALSTNDSYILYNYNSRKELDELIKKQEEKILALKEEFGLIDTIEDVSADTSSTTENSEN